MAKIVVQNTDINIISVNGDDYISLTDLARHKSDEPNAVIANWMRNRNTIEYLGVWERLYNINLNPPNLRGLDFRPVLMHLHFLQKNGLRPQMQSA